MSWYLICSYSNWFKWYSFKLNLCQSLLSFEPTPQPTAAQWVTFPKNLLVQSRNNATLYCKEQLAFHEFSKQTRPVLGIAARVVLIAFITGSHDGF